MSIDCGHFDVATGWANPVKTIPFTPKGILVFGGDMSFDGFQYCCAPFGNNTFSIGVGSQTGPFQGEVAVSDNPEPTIPLESLARRNYPGRVTTTARLFGTARGSLDPNFANRTLSITSWDACGWTLSAGGAGPTSWRVFYLAFGGVTLNAVGKSITIPGSGADVTVTGLPFNPLTSPTGIVFLTTHGSAGADTGYHNIGFYANGNSFCSSLNVGYVGFPAFGYSMPGVIDYDGINTLSVSALTSDGFTISQSAPNGTWPVLCLILNDPQGEFVVGSTGWGSHTITTPSQPEAALFTSGMTIDHDTDPDHFSGQWSMGMASPLKSGGTVLGEGGGYSTDYLRWSTMRTDNERVLETYDVYTSTTPDSYLSADVFHSGGIDVVKTGAAKAIDYGWLTMKVSEASYSPCKFVPQIYRIIRL